LTNSRAGKTETIDATATPVDIIRGLNLDKKLPNDKFNKVYVLSEQMPRRMERVCESGVSWSGQKFQYNPTSDPAVVIKGSGVHSADNMIIRKIKSFSVFDHLYYCELQFGTEYAHTILAQRSTTPDMEEGQLISERG
jgi:hypothetical protein